MSTNLREPLLESYDALDTPSTAVNTIRVPVADQIRINRQTTNAERTFSAYGNVERDPVAFAARKNQLVCLHVIFLMTWLLNR